MEGRRLTSGTPDSSQALRVKVLPFPASLSARTSPPINSTSLRTILNPRPVPPYFLVVELSAVAQQRDTLTPYEVFHFAGHRITGKRWLDVLTQAARARGWVKPDSHLKMDNLPWAVIRMGALFVPTWAALLEMRYLWEMPHALGNEKLTALIGSEPHTPLLLAVEAALVDLGLIATAPLRALARGQKSTIVVQ